MADFLPLRDYQRDAVDRVQDAHAAGTPFPAVVLPPGCHRAGQNVLMYDGSVRAVENVRTGDLLMGPDSTPRTVLSLAGGTGAMMEIRPVKGEPWVVNDAHVLTLVRTAQGGPYPSERGGVITDVDLRDWWQWSRYQKHTHKLFRVPVEFPGREVPDLDPYFLGVVLGDGSLSVPYRLSIATGDPEITELCEQTAADHGIQVRRDGRKMIQHNFTSGHKRNGRRGGQNPLVTKLAALGLCPIACADRFVPDIYKLGGRDIRREVLAGLIDSDGARSGGGYDFGSKSERLADDVTFIARSLGLAAYMTKRPSGHYRVSISGDCTVIPVRIRRKIAPVRGQIKDVLRTGFQVIPTGTTESFYGFTLDGDQRYLLGDFTVTHNSGKTVILAHLAAEYTRSYGKRVMILVHRDEIADQTVAEMQTAAPHLKIGKVKAGDNDLMADVIVVSVQTAWRADRLKELVGSQTYRKIGLIICDEVHHVVSPSWIKVLNAFPKALRAGFTATLERGDGVGLGSVIDDVVYTRSYLWMITHGYLVNPVGRMVTAEALRLSGVHRSGKDYQASSLGDAMIESGSGRVIARAYREHAADRSGIIFTPSVASAHDVADGLGAEGISCAVITGGTPREERLAVYERSRTGDCRVIVNCAVLTEGANFPWISCVVPRITPSAGLWQQMAGRALRTYPGKKDALILSVGGTGGKFCTLVDLDPGLVRAVLPGESLADAVIREAEEDNKVIPAGHPAFSLRARDVDLFAASASAWLRTEAGVMFIPVTDGEIFLWAGQGGTWQVRHAPHSMSRRKIVWPKLHGGLSLDDAMLWGEAEAEERDHGIGRAASVSSRTTWRKRKDPPTADQLNTAHMWEVTVPPGITRSGLSDLLSMRHCTLKFDPHTPRTETHV